MTSITELCKQAYNNASRHGFHEKPVDFDNAEDTRHILSLLMLVTTEVAEAAEEVRRGIDKPAFGLELADICIRVFDIAAATGCDLEQAITTKMYANELRMYRHGGKRA